MTNQLTQIKFQLNYSSDSVPAVVEKIKETHGKAYSAFSGRPISLCKSLERRGELRMKFEEPVYLWPVNVQGDLAVCQRTQPTVAVTRDISLHGVGISFDEDVETEMAVIEFDLFGEGTEFLLVEIRWKSFLEAHSYAGGGLIRGTATVIR